MNIHNPAVRAWIYNILIAAGAVAVGYGLITAEQGGLWLALAGAILSSSNGLARANVPQPQPPFADGEGEFK